jgi:hypothetical protein
MNSEEYRMFNDWLLYVGLSASDVSVSYVPVRLV